MEDFQARIVERQDIEATVSVEVPQQVVAATFKNVMRSLTQQVRVPGFRPGKAPKRVILSQIGGEEVLQYEVHSRLVEHFIPLAVQKLELRMIGLKAQDDEPTLPTNDADFTFEFVCELLPEVALPDYRAIVIDQQTEELSEEAVDEFIDGLRDQFAILEPVEDRSVEATDMITLGLQSSPDGQGLPFDLTTASDAILEQIVGKAIDEEFDLVLDIPRKENDAENDNVDASASEDGSGAADATDDAPEIGDASETDDIFEDVATEPEALAVFIKNIYVKTLPERDDDFAETLGQDSWAEVEKNIRNNLQREQDNETFQNQTSEFVDKLLELTEVTIPTQILEDARHNVLQRIEGRVKEQGLTMREYRKMLEDEGETESFETNLQNNAEITAKRDVVLNALLEAEGTELDKGEFERVLERDAQGEGTSLRKFKKELGEDGISNYHYMLRRDRAVVNVVREILGISESEEVAS